MSDPRLAVTSHVGRDILQSAEVFKTEKHVVWEYVSNGLQYVDPGVVPSVRVAVTDGAQRRIVITDNGRGMRLEGLQNFFVMHGVNEDRKAGRAGRGRFGTGKSAAFGIAGCLTITTVRGGLATKVRLRRSEIEAMDQGDQVPVHIVYSEQPTDEPNGTAIEISEIAKKRIDLGAIIGFIENHIARWPHASVTVNHH
jgi:DNA topoisomerase VI subunit B